MEWLEESEKSLDSEVEIANDPDRIKTQLAQHKVRQLVHDVGVLGSGSGSGLGLGFTIRWM